MEAFCADCAHNSSLRWECAVSHFLDGFCPSRRYCHCDDDSGKSAFDQGLWNLRSNRDTRCLSESDTSSCPRVYDESASKDGESDGPGASGGDCSERAVEDYPYSGNHPCRVGRRNKLEWSCNILLCSNAHHFTDNG